RPQPPGGSRQSLRRPPSPSARIALVTNPTPHPNEPLPNEPDARSGSGTRPCVTSITRFSGARLEATCVHKTGDKLRSYGQLYRFAVLPARRGTGGEQDYRSKTRFSLPARRMIAPPPRGVLEFEIDRAGFPMRRSRGRERSSQAGSL